MLTPQIYVNKWYIMDYKKETIKFMVVSILYVSEVGVYHLNINIMFFIYLS